MRRLFGAAVVASQDGRSGSVYNKWTSRAIPMHQRLPGIYASIPPRRRGNIALAMGDSRGEPKEREALVVKSECCVPGTSARFHEFTYSCSD